MSPVSHVTATVETPRGGEDSGASRFRLHGDIVSAFTRRFRTQFQGETGDAAEVDGRPGRSRRAGVW
jgi:hypothetical protein